MIRDWTADHPAEVAIGQRISMPSMAVYLSPGKGDAGDLDQRAPWPDRLPRVGRLPAAAPNKEESPCRTSRSNTSRR